MGNKKYAIINNIFCLSMNDMKWNCSFPMNTIASVNGRNTTHSEKRKLRISIIPKMRPRSFLCLATVSSSDVAELVAFLASAKSSKTTGAQIPMNCLSILFSFN
jgi:NAD(P)-dependent dehydrogenase (short-subunit alcohol dehydrogenase family)